MSLVHRSEQLDLPARSIRVTFCTFNEDDLEVSIIHDVQLYDLLVIQ